MVATDQPSASAQHGDRSTSALLLGLIAITLVTFLAFRPALSGPFLLDDFPTLRGLSQIDLTTAVLPQVRQYALAGSSGLRGRPLSLASFALEAPSWPDNPETFKRTNLLLHIVNGLLLFALLSNLTKILQCPGLQGVGLSLGITAVWLLHPMQISTVMYVVQRMTLLSASFTLLGLSLYCKGRGSLADRPWQGFVLIGIGLLPCTILAVLAKESGVLSPVFALVLELTLLRAVKGDRWRLWQRLGLAGLTVGPLAIAGYFAWHWSDYTDYSDRNFSLPERLLTEGRVLSDYLRLIAFPMTTEFGIFGDGYLISRGWLQPPMTLLCAILIGGLLVGGIALRRRAPWISFAILWFFAGHLLESTIVPLEIYFEHRNYLPMLGPVAAGIWALMQFRPDAPAIAASLTAAVSLVLALLTFSSSLVWGNEALAAEVWPKDHPRSERARQMSAHYWTHRRRFDRAEEQLAQAALIHPENPHLFLQVAQMRCVQGLDARQALKTAIAGLRTASLDRATLDTLDSLRMLASEPRCESLSLQDIHAVLDQLLANNQYRDSDELFVYLQYIRGTTFGNQGRIDDAVEAFEQSARRHPLTQTRYWQTLWLLCVGRADEAERYLALAVDENARRSWNDLSWDEDIVRLRKALADVRKLNGKAGIILVGNTEFKVTPLPAQNKQ